jgi:hypothetical protein
MYKKPAFRLLTYPAPSPAREMRFWGLRGVYTQALC